VFAAHRRWGFSLVEVLIALAVMSIAVLGLGSVLVSGLKAQSKTEYSAVAHSVANRVLDRLVRRLQSMSNDDAGASFWDADLSSEASPWTELGQSETVGNTVYEYLITATPVAGFPSENGLKLVTVKVRWTDDGARVKAGTGKQEISATRLLNRRPGEGS
jgi:prepilin-type N-terminal cleavage/methylation domain-containing protein